MASRIVDLDRHLSEKLHLGLLKVCRQIHAEVALLPFTDNVIVFDTLISPSYILNQFLQLLVLEQARAFASLMLAFQDHDRALLPKTAQGMRQDLAGLQSLVYVTEVRNGVHARRFMRMKSPGRRSVDALTVFERLPLLRRVDVRAFKGICARVSTPKLSVLKR
ncbi:hypothetical protein LTR86_006373 [Recurvomyces mirabilis]|nr:hypothetical protein LTR86_006373 [Recurvomyces mirabilis]